MKRKYTTLQDLKQTVRKDTAVPAFCVAAALLALTACGGEDRSGSVGGPEDAGTGSPVSSGEAPSEVMSADPESDAEPSAGLADDPSPDGGLGGEPVAGMVAELPQPYARYMEVLEQIREEGRDPEGREYHSDPNRNFENNCFAILDVDNDGRQELIFNFNESYMGAMCEVVYDYDAETDTLHEELAEWVSTEYYHGGLVKVEMSHNHGRDPEGRGVWPYMVYRYDEEQDSYRLLYTVDGWDGQINGEGFPDELDADGDKLLYCITAEDESGTVQASADISLSGSGGDLSGDGIRNVGEDSTCVLKTAKDEKSPQRDGTMLLDREEYESWAEELLHEWSRIDVTYHPMTEDAVSSVGNAYRQAAAYAAQSDIWFVGEEAGPGAVGYLLYDLDGDGSLELMVNTVQGTGRYSWNYFYGLTDGGKVTELELVRLCAGKERGWNADFDIGRTRLQAYQDRDGIIYYEGNDYVREGNYGGYDETGFYYLKDGVVYQDSIRRRTEFFGSVAGHQEGEIHYYGMEEDEEKLISDEEITEEQYEMIREEYVRDMTEVRVYQNWEYFMWDEITEGELTEETIRLRLFDSFLGSE